MSKNVMPRKSRVKLNRKCLLTSIFALFAFSCGGRDVIDEDANTTHLKDLAIEAVRQQSALPKAKLEVSSLQAVEWPDGSLGCPQPGVMYTQMVTPGFRAIVIGTIMGTDTATATDTATDTVTATESNRQFTVHIAHDKAFVCENSQTNAAPKEDSSSDLDTVLIKAKQHLANQLNIKEEEILLRSVKELRWLAKEDLNCKALAERIQQGEKFDSGYRLILQTNKQHFIYYSNSELEVAPCD